MKFAICQELFDQLGGFCVPQCNDGLRMLLLQSFAKAAVCDLIKDRQKRNGSHNGCDNGPQETAYDNAPVQRAHQSRSIL